MKKLMISIKNFTQKEFKCKCGCGAFVKDDPAILALQALRDRLTHLFHRDIKLIVLSGTRCEKHNKKVGGIPDSMHLVGKAFDIYSPEINVNILYNEAINSGLFSTIIKYERSNFIHIDQRPRDRIRYWSWYK